MDDLFKFIFLCFGLLTWHLDDSPLVLIPVIGMIALAIIYVISKKILKDDIDDDDDDEEDANVHMI